MKLGESHKGRRKPTEQETEQQAGSLLIEQSGIVGESYGLLAVWALSIVGIQVPIVWEC